MRVIDFRVRPPVAGFEAAAMYAMPDRTATRARSFPQNVMVDMHHRLLDSRLQVFARARHGLPFSHARRCAETLREFLGSAHIPQQGSR